MWSDTWLSIWLNSSFTFPVWLLSVWVSQIYHNITLNIAMLQFWCIWCWLISCDLQWQMAHQVAQQFLPISSAVWLWSWASGSVQNTARSQNWQNVWQSCILVSKIYSNFIVEHVLNVEKHSVSYQNIPATKCFCWPAGVLWGAEYINVVIDFLLILPRCIFSM